MWQKLNKTLYREQSSYKHSELIIIESFTHHSVSFISSPTTTSSLFLDTSLSTLFSVSSSTITSVSRPASSPVSASIPPPVPVSISASVSSLGSFLIYFILEISQTTPARVRSCKICNNRLKLTIGDPLHRDWPLLFLPYNSDLNFLLIGFKCMKLQNPDLVHSPVSYCL